MCLNWGRGSREGDDAKGSSHGENVDVERVNGVLHAIPHRQKGIEALDQRRVSTEQNPNTAEYPRGVDSVQRVQYQETDKG
jgi:hypothetical protein